MSSAAAKVLPFVPFHKPLIGEDDINAVVEVLRDGWLTSGPRVKEFEAEFARYTHASHAVAVNSGTAALHLALAGAGVGEGDEVLLPTMTFAATGEVVLHCRARPILVDCERDSFQVDPCQMERAITSRTRVLLVVHHAGCPADMDSIMDIARRHGLRVVEDAAHALPALYKGRPVGSIGDVTCFSFYATKTITTGEGGMSTTEDADYATRMRLLSLHGISRDAWKRYTAEGVWRYEILESGFKYNLTDLQAALGRAQLAKCDAMHRRRSLIAARYSQALSEVEAFETPQVPPGLQHAWHLYVVQVNSDVLRIDRDQVIEELRRRRIGTSVHFIPLHLHRLYREMGYRPGQFPNSERSFNRAISLPIYPAMTDSDIDAVISTLLDVASEFRK